MSDTIQELIGKLEAAEVGSPDLDALVHVAVANDPNTYVVEPSPDSIFSHQPGWYRTGCDLSCKADPVTTSLDAALALAERVVPGCSWCAETHGRKPFANVCLSDEIGFGSEASTPALALTIAILKAQAEARV